MNVVGGRIAIDDLDGLIGDHAQHVGMVFAAALIELDGFFGNIESAVAEALFHIDEHVAEVTAGGHHVFRHVGALAGGVLAHVDLGGLGSFAFKFHGAANAGGRGGIDWSGGCCRGGWGGGGSSGLLFFFAASGEEDEAKRSGQAPNCYESFLFHVLPYLSRNFDYSN